MARLHKLRPGGLPCAALRGEVHPEAASEGGGGGGGDGGDGLHRGHGRLGHALTGTVPGRDEEGETRQGQGGNSIALN